MQNWSKIPHSNNNIKSWKKRISHEAVYAKCFGSSFALFCCQCLENELKYEWFTSLNEICFTIKTTNYISTKSFFSACHSFVDKFVCVCVVCLVFILYSPARNQHNLSDLMPVWAHAISLLICYNITWSRKIVYVDVQMHATHVTVVARWNIDGSNSKLKS